MKGFGEKNQSKKEITSKNKQKVNIGQLINKAFELQSQGRKLEAAKYYAYLIKQGIKDHRVFSNYGIFLNEIGKHKEAELELKKAISLNPEYPNAYYNLAILYMGQENLEKAELALKKAIKLIVELIVENSLKTAIKFNPYCTSKNFIKFFLKTIIAIKKLFL